MPGLPLTPPTPPHPSRPAHPQYVTKFTSQAWAQAFLSQLERGAQAPTALSTPALPLPLPRVVDTYASASRRLIVLGVGGALLPMASEADTPPDQAEHLSLELTHTLRALLRDPSNTLLLVSGRRRAALLELFRDVAGGAADGGEDVATPGQPPGVAADDMERLWLLSENGVYARRGWGPWELTSQAAQEAGWIEQVEEMMRYFEERTPRVRLRPPRLAKHREESRCRNIGRKMTKNPCDHGRSKIKEPHFSTTVARRSAAIARTAKAPCRNYFEHDQSADPL